MNISPEALTRAREAAGISQRELARQVARISPELGTEGALAVRLSRLERGQGRAVSADLAETLGLALGFEDADNPRHLAEADRWEWVTPDGRKEIPLGFRELLFSSPSLAYDARDLVAAEMTGAHPWRGAVLETLPLSKHPGAPDLYPPSLAGIPIPRHEVNAFLLTDPHEDDLHELTLCERALRGDMEAAEVFALRAATGDLLTLFDPDVLLEVARRRDQAETEHPSRDPATRADCDRELETLERIARDYLGRRLAQLDAA